MDAKSSRTPANIGSSNLHETAPPSIASNHNDMEGSFSAQPLRLVYVTAQVPWGPGEQFILTEVRGLRMRGHDVLMIPLRPHLAGCWPDGEDLRAHARPEPLFLPRYLAMLFFWMCIRPRLMLQLIWLVLVHSGGGSQTLKNAVVLPKAADVAYHLHRNPPDHIHAHWATTPATLALAVSHLTGIPWSFTAHRHDIAARNLLPAKAESARFVRVISEDGRRELARYLRSAGRIRLIHMGVKIPASTALHPNLHRSAPVVVVPAALSVRKGHEFVLQAIHYLHTQKAAEFRCLFVGQGPEEAALRKLHARLKLGASVEFVGVLPHDQLLGMYRCGEVAVVLLPSVTMPDGEREGIPVSLIEAMAHGIPVVTTPTGGTAELVDGVGMIVAERDPVGLATALNKLLLNPAFAADLGQRGRQRIEMEFALSRIVSQLEDEWVSDRAGLSKADCPTAEP